MNKLFFHMKINIDYRLKTMVSQVEFFNKLKQKVPCFVLGIHYMITNNVFQACQTKTKEQLDDLKFAFWLYFPSICLLCFLFEIWHACRAYEITFKNYIQSRKLIFMIVSCFTNLWIFLVVSLYTTNGAPVTCFWSYSNNLFTVIFIMSIGMLYFICTVEEFYWQDVIDKELELSKQDDDLETAPLNKDSQTTNYGSNKS